MSASNGFLAPANGFSTPAAAYVFTDAAVCDASFKVIAFMSKVALLPQINAVVTATGSTMVLPFVASALAASELQDFDDMLRQAPAILQRYLQTLSEHGQAHHFDNFRLGIAGWSVKANAPALYCLQGGAGLGVRPFEMTPCAKFINPAAAHEGDQSTIDMQFDPGRPAESGLRVMRAQREMKFGTHHAIGGWCQMTTVTRSCIATGVIERWPDRIGERIAPTVPAPAARSLAYSQMG